MTRTSLTHAMKNAAYALPMSLLVLFILRDKIFLGLAVPAALMAYGLAWLLCSRRATVVATEV